MALCYAMQQSSYLSVVVEDDDDPGVDVSSVVHRFIGHAARDRTWKTRTRTRRRTRTRKRTRTGTGTRKRTRTRTRTQQQQQHNNNTTRMDKQQGETGC